jgi:hypothetical protein
MEGAAGLVLRSFPVLCNYACLREPRNLFQKRFQKKKRDRCPGVDSSDQSLRDVFNDVS